jgi:hypothetical protein
MFLLKRMDKMAWTVFFALLAVVAVVLGTPGAVTKKPKAVDNNKYVEIENVGYEVCLDFIHKIETLPCDDGSRQKWSLIGSGPVKIIRQKSSGSCLGVGKYERGKVNNHTVFLTWCNSTLPYQQWKIEDRAGGEISLISVHNGECLDSDAGKVFFSDCKRQTDDYRWWEPRG